MSTLLTSLSLAVQTRRNSSELTPSLALTTALPLSDGTNFDTDTPL